jgi:hypothetical protein
MIINFGIHSSRDFRGWLIDYHLEGNETVARIRVFVVVGCRLCTDCCVAVRKPSPASLSFRRIDSTKMSEMGQLAPAGNRSAYLNSTNLQDTCSIFLMMAALSLCYLTTMCHMKRVEEKIV